MSDVLYHCNDCGEDCWEPTRYKTYDREEFWGAPVTNISIMELCPACGSDDIEETTVCRTCGIYRTLDGYDDCRECKARADAAEARAATLALARRPGPGFLRIGSGREPVIFDADVSFELGKIRVMRDYGSEVAVFACGPILKRALAAADRLKGEINVTVAEVHTLKPLDYAGVGELLARAGAAVTVEDHNIIGGLGSAIAEAAADLCPVPIVRVGLKDTYPESGEAEALLDKYAMGVKDIEAAVRQALMRKGAAGREAR